MLGCDNCTEQRLQYKGTDNPEVYIITHKPHDEDWESGYPLSGDAGNYLFHMLSYADLVNKVRIASLCNCDVTDETEINFDNCVTCHLLADIFTSNPKILVGVGKEVIQYFLGSQFTSLKAVCGRVFDIKLFGYDFKFMPIYHPKYVLSELVASEEEDKFTTVPADFSRMINNIALACKGEYDQVMNKKISKFVMTYDEYERLYHEEGYDTAERLAYDIETNALPILTSDSEIIGFSHAKNKDEGFYVCMKSLDHDMSEEELKKCKELLLHTLKTHKLIVHNSMYERPYTLKELNYDIPFDQLDDTLVMARLMLGGKVGAGLKPQAQNNLGYPDWETDLGDYLSAATYLLKTAVSEECYEKGSFQNIVGMSGNKWCQEYEEQLDKFREVCYRYYNIQETEYLLVLLWEKWVKYYHDNHIEVPSGNSVIPYNTIPSKILCAYGAMDSIATFDLYDYYINVMKRESKEGVDLFFGYKTFLEHFYVGYTFERNGIFFNDDIVTAERKLYNDTATQALKDMIKSPRIKDLIIEKCGASYLAQVLSDYYPDIANKSGYQVNYERSTGKYSVFYTTDWNKYKRVAKSYLYEIPMSDYDRALVNEEVYRLAMNDVDSYTDFDQLKSIFNPSSSKHHNIISQALSHDDLSVADKIHTLTAYSKSANYTPNIREIIEKTGGLTPSELRYIEACDQALTIIRQLKDDRNISFSSRRKAIEKVFGQLSAFTDIQNKFLYNVLINNIKITKTTEFDPDTAEDVSVEKLAAYTPTQSKLIDLSILHQTLECNDADHAILKLCCEISDEKKLKKEYGDNWYLQRREMFAHARELFKSPIYNSQRVLSAVNSSYSIQFFDDESIIDIFNRMLLEGIDSDNKESWTDEFTWLINFRVFKKITKIITSYIDGSIGRQSVMVVDREELESGQSRILRKRGYYDNDCKIDRTTEAYLTQPSYGVGTAETLRWKSGFHTIPWGSPVKKFYTSRYRGGTIFQPDYSQNEVRAMAATSNCQALIEAFKAGTDIHRFIASKVFNKPEAEILDVERRFSKMAVFSILYGALPESFANNYLDGDLERAKKIYDDFYAGFPEIKEWGEKMHQYYDENGRVPVNITGMWLNIAAKGKADGHRKAGNYPIQSSSSMIVGSVIYEIIKFIEENNLKSKPYLFVHDSIEMDCYPYELIKYAIEVKKLLIDIPLDKFGMPVKADVSLGKSFGHELEMEDIEEVNEDMTECVITLAGYKDEIEETVENWKLAYKTAEIIDYWHWKLDENGVKMKDENGDKIKVHEWEPEYISYKELFVVKRSYNKDVGKYRYKGIAKIHIKYYE